MASQITNNSIVYSESCSGWQQNTPESSVLITPSQGASNVEIVPCHDIIMLKYDNPVTGSSLWRNVESTPSELPW